VQSSARYAQEIGPVLIDWGGAQRWVRGKLQREQLDRIAADAGGHVTLFRGGERSGDVRAPLNDVERNLQLRLKQSFDPDGILNPGRLYRWL
jgi:glycolate oxidase FAD binding subunit